MRYRQDQILAGVKTPRIAYRHVDKVDLERVERVHLTSYDATATLRSGPWASGLSVVAVTAGVLCVEEKRRDLLIPVCTGTHQVLLS